MKAPDHSEYTEGRVISNFFGEYVGTFLNIGALDGKDRDNCYGLHVAGWGGLEIEPNPFMFALLVQNFHFYLHKVQCVNAALMPAVGFVKFKDTFNVQQNWHQHTSTCMENPTDEVRSLLQREYYVMGITPQMVADKFGTKWEMISLDIEGLDIPVLKVMAPLLSETKLLCVEDTIPGAPFDEGYYKQLMDACAAHGFTKVVGRTHGPEKPANTLLTRP